MSIAKFIKLPKRKKSTDPFVIPEKGIKKGNLGMVYRRGWTEDVFNPQAGEKETIGKNFNLTVIYLLIVVLIIALFIIIGRVAWLQIVKNDYYYSLAEGNRIRIERIEPKRGIIYDREFNPLVSNVANFLLYFIPADLPDNEDEYNKILNRVGEILSEPERERMHELLIGVPHGSLEAYNPLFITDNIAYEKAILLYLESATMPGVILSNRTRRNYNLCRDASQCVFALSHILGYTGKINQDELTKFGQEYLPIDYIGKMGIEYFWENELRGINGEKYIEVDALGKEKRIISQKQGEDGHNLVLSLDLALQEKLEKVMTKSLEGLHLTKGAAVAMDPSSGEILALVSLPTFSNNAFAHGITSQEYDELISNLDKPLFNRCISGEYPSGSTIKPIIAAAALEEGIITESTRFNSVGGIQINQWFFPDWQASGHGLTEVKRAIAESINTFFYYIGGGYKDFEGLGIDRIVQYGKLFGLSEQTGIDLIGEADGFLPSKKWKETVKGENWYIGDTYHLSIGQGDLLVTPLQVAVFTSVFANGGKLYRPHLVSQVLTSNDKLIGQISKEPIREGFINDYNINVVRQGMRQTITSGSAQSLQSVPVAVAGKTGTAQWSSDSDKEPHAWFTGFAPYDNPEIVVTILIEEGGEGSRVAAPIAKEVLEWYFGQ